MFENKNENITKTVLSTTSVCHLHVLNFAKIYTKTNLHVIALPAGSAHACSTYKTGLINKIIILNPLTQSITLQCIIDLFLCALDMNDTSNHIRITI